MLFAYTDMLREAHKVHRIVEFLTTLSGAPGPEKDESGIYQLSAEIPAEVMILSIHRWIRGLSNHAALYRGLQKKRKKLKEEKRFRREDPDDMGAAEVAVRVLTEPGDKLCQAILLAWEPAEKMCAAKLRLMLKNKRGPAFEGNLVENIKQQLLRLDQSHVIDKLEEWHEEPVKTRKSKDGSSAPKRAKSVKRTDSTQLFKKRCLKDMGEEPEVPCLRQFIHKDRASKQKLEFPAYVAIAPSST